MLIANYGLFELFETSTISSLTCCVGFCATQLKKYDIKTWN